MSNQQSSLALDEMRDQGTETTLELYIKTRQTTRNVEAERQPKTVRVCGTITVSF